MSTVMVYANKEYNLVETDLRPGTTVRLEVEENQTWSDAYITCDADGYIGTFWEVVRHTFARLRSAPMFALTACVTECGKEPVDECLIRVGKGMSYLVGGDPNKKYSVYLFANDIHGFYWNNGGGICVRVTTRK